MAVGQKLRVRAHLDDQTPVHDDDQVGVDDRREPVGDDESRTAMQQIRERRLDEGLDGRVQRAGRLVEDDEGRDLCRVHARSPGAVVRPG